MKFSMRHRVEHLAAEALGDDAGADALAGGVDGGGGAGGAAADDEHVERVLGVDRARPARSAAPVSSLATICSRLMRPWSNGSPLRNTVGTAMHLAGVDLVLEQRAVDGGVA